MKQRLAAIAALAVSLAVVLAPGTALAVVGPEFETYVGCGTTASTAPSHECELGDAVGAFFESSEEVEFDVCVEFPNEEVLCAEEQRAEAGVLYVNEIETELAGTHHVFWFLTGTEEEIGSWSFEMKEPPPPPAPPPPPTITVPVPTVVPVPVPVPVPSRESSGCANAHKRVRALEKRLRHASSRRKPILRAKLRKARAAVRRAC